MRGEKWNEKEKVEGGRQCRRSQQTAESTADGKALKSQTGLRAPSLPLEHFSPCCTSWFFKLSILECGAPKENIFGLGHQRHAVICCVDSNFGPMANTHQHAGLKPAKTDLSPTPGRGHRSQAKIPGKCDSQTSLCIDLDTMATGHLI